MSTPSAPATNDEAIRAEIRGAFSKVSETLRLSFDGLREETASVRAAFVAAKRAEVRGFIAILITCTVGFVAIFVAIWARL